MKKISKIISMVLVCVLISSMAVSAGVVYVNPVSVYSQSFANLSACPDGWVSLPADRASFVETNDFVTQVSNGGWRLYSTEELDFTGYNYEIEFVTSKVYGDAYFHLTEDSFTTFYGNYLPTTGYTIAMHVKKDGATHPYYELYKNGTKLKEYDPGKSSYESDYLTFKLTVTSDITTLYVINTTNGTVLGTITHKDTDPVYVGSLGMTTNNTTANVTKLYSVSARKIGINNFKIHNNFSKYDTIAGLENLGWMTSDKARITDENGLELNHKNDTEFGGGSDTLIYDSVLDGTYTVESSYYISYNKAAILVNYVDDNNYYAVRYGKVDSGTGASGSKIRIVKVVGGVETTLKDVYDNEATSQLFNTSLKPNKVTVTNTDNSVEIDVTLIDKNGTEYTDTYTDTDETRISSGKIGIQCSAAGKNYVNYIKVYHGDKEPNIIGEYYVDGVKSAEYTNGKISLDMPTKLFGTESVVLSALYVDNIMEDISIYDLDDFLGGKKELFDTTSVTSDNVKVKTFIWKSLEQIIPLNKDFSFPAIN